MILKLFTLCATIKRGVSGRVLASPGYLMRESLNRASLCEIMPKDHTEMVHFK